MILLREKQQIDNNKTYHVWSLWQGVIGGKTYIVKWQIWIIVEAPILVAAFRI